MFHTYETAVPMKDSTLPPSYTRAPRWNANSTSIWIGLLTAYAHLGMPFTTSSAAPGTLLSMPARLPTTRAPAGSAAAADPMPSCARCYSPGPRPLKAPEESPGFAVFALRDLKAGEEVVKWEWDDNCVVHQLPAVLTAPGMFL
ncbi:hypothetical protein H0H87_000556, partial [Tephrocybe sp. NHM501043]